MALTNPWLAAPVPEKKLSRDVLEGRISNLLSTHNMCVIATTGQRPAGHAGSLLPGARTSK